MKALFTLTIFALLLSGCGTLERYKNRNEVEASSTITSATTTTIQEKVDTSVQIKGDSVVAVRPLDDLLQGKPIKATDGKNTVKVTYDKKTGDVRAVGITEPHQVEVTIDRTTHTKEATQKDDIVKTKDVIVEEKRKGTSNFLWGIIITLSILVIILILILSKKARDALRIF